MSRIKKENILLLGAIFAPLILIGYFLFRAMQLTPLTALCNIWQYERRHIS